MLNGYGCCFWTSYFITYLFIFFSKYCMYVWYMHTFYLWYLLTHLLLSEYPRGWVYLRSTKKYYRAVFELVDWTKADMRCREFGANSRLVDINDDTENTAIKRFIASFDGKNTLLFVVSIDVKNVTRVSYSGSFNVFKNILKFLNIKSQRKRNSTYYYYIQHRCDGGDISWSVWAMSMQLRKNVQLLLLMTWLDSGGQTSRSQ